MPIFSRKAGDKYSFSLKSRETDWRGLTRFGFDDQYVSNLTRTSARISHNGCVNTVKWHENGNTLVSGSDDLKIKVWNTGADLNNIKNVHDIRTQHRSNIFCVDFNDFDENVVFSCAADGTLRSSYLNSNSLGSLLLDSDELIHMFICDRENKNLLYTAEEAGRITRVDIRQRDPTVVFHNTRDGGRRFRGSPVKSLAQPHGGNTCSMVLGGAGLLVGEIDLRLVSPRQSFLRSWSPETHPTSHIINKNDGGGLSASCVQISSDDRRLLVNYQSDQIYVFDYHLHSRQGAEFMFECMPPLSCLGGHLNHDTFLKTAAFFGPREEFVVAGSDAGGLWIWDAHSGDLGDTRFGIGASPVKVLDVLEADGRTCNGVVPHPFLPVLASYGIDSDVKIWKFETADEDVKPEDVLSKTRGAPTLCNSKIDSSPLRALIRHGPVRPRQWSWKARLPELLEDSKKLAFGESAEDMAVNSLTMTAASYFMHTHRETRQVADPVRYRKIVAGIRNSFDERNYSPVPNWSRAVAGAGIASPSDTAVGRAGCDIGLWRAPSFPDDIGFSDELDAMPTTVTDEAMQKYLPEGSKGVFEERVLQLCWNILQVLEIVNESKLEGNAYFKAGLCDCAVYSYERALRYVHVLRQFFDILFLRVEKDLMYETVIWHKHFNPEPWPNRINRRFLESRARSSVGGVLNVSDSEDEDDEDGGSGGCCGHDHSHDHHEHADAHALEEEFKGREETKIACRLLRNVLENIWHGRNGSVPLPDYPPVALHERKILSNQAAAWLQLEEYSQALKCCTRGLHVRTNFPGDRIPNEVSGVPESFLPPEAKLLYRRACASLGLKEPESAVVDLTKALELGPGDTAVSKKLKEAKRLWEEEKQIQSKKYRKMFG